MTAVIELMAAGARPAAEGWYIRREPDGYIDIVEIVDTPDGLAVSTTGCEMWEDITDDMRRGCTFTARIFPDRVEAPAG